MNAPVSRETFRSLANRRARSYCRDDLVLTWAQMALTTNLRGMRAMVNTLSRDQIITDLRDELRLGWGGNGVRAAYIAERCARLRDRALIRQMAEELSGKYETPEIVGIRRAA